MLALALDAQEPTVMHPHACMHTCPPCLCAPCRELGGEYSCGENWAEHAVADGKLVTGASCRSFSLAHTLAAVCRELAHRLRGTAILGPALLV